MDTNTRIETATSSLRRTKVAKHSDHTYQCLWVGNKEMGDHTYYLPLPENLGSVDDLRQASEKTMVSARELVEVAALNAYIIEAQDRLFAEASMYSDNFASEILELIHDGSGSGDTASHLYGDDLISRTVAPMAKAICSHATIEYMSAGSIPDSQLSQRVGCDAFEALRTLESQDQQSPGM
jgi:hypothetical protein